MIRPIYEYGTKKIWVTGHRGMVGSAIVRRLQAEGIEPLVAGREIVDLVDQASVRAFYAREKPEVVIVAAAKVGGIHANDTYPADFLYENLAIASNVIEGAHRADVEKLLFLGSSCIYPRLAPQPISEDALLTGPLEPTNEWYAIAKIAGIKLCQAYRKQHGRDFISCQPTNLYGPGDNFDLATSHVLPALLRKAHEAKVSGARTMTVWGTGTPRREFLHVDDLAAASLHLLSHYSGLEPINVGCGEDLSIAQVARLIAGTVGFDGDLIFDATKPDGAPRKLLDIRRLAALGWRPTVALPDGLETYYRDFLSVRRSLVGSRSRS